ncbi:MAG: flippase-like domain-containing protein [Chloroflexi bacterium]|nr:flippase-like domain-containing protein [Chloroflexota bacterium]
MNRWRIGLLGGIVSLLAIVFIISQVKDVAALGAALAQARYVYLLPTAGLLLIGLVARAIRWRVLLGGGLPLWRAFNIMNVAYLVNGVLPLRMGEVARVYLATRADPPVPVFQTASTIIVERLLDLLAVAMLLAAALAAGPVPDDLRAAAAAVAPAAFIVFLGMVLLSRRRTLALRLLAALVGRFDRAGVAGNSASGLSRLSVWFVQFLDGLLPLAQPRALLLALGWTAVAWGFSVAAGYVLMFAFYDIANWMATGLYIAAVAFSIALPAVPGNLGTYEGSILLALAATGYGEPFEVAAAFALVVHGVNLGVHVSTGIVGFIEEGISLGQLSRDVQGMGRGKVIVHDEV